MHVKISSGSPLYWKKKNKKAHLYEEEETLSKKQFSTPPYPDTVHLSESFTLQTQVGTFLETPGSRLAHCSYQKLQTSCI